MPCAGKYAASSESPRARHRSGTGFRQFGAGSIPLTKTDFISNYLIVAIPILGSIIYNVLGLLWDSTFLRTGGTWRQHFKKGFVRVFVRTTIALVVLAMLLGWSDLKYRQGSGLLLLVVIVAIFGIFWIIDAMFHASEIRKPEEQYIEAYLRSPRTKLGVSILNSFTLFGYIIIIDMASSLLG